MRIPEERPCAQGAVEAAKRRGASPAREGNDGFSAEWSGPLRKRKSQPGKGRAGRTRQRESTARPIRDFQEMKSLPQAGPEAQGRKMGAEAGEEQG